MSTASLASAPSEPQPSELRIFQPTGLSISIGSPLDALPPSALAIIRRVNPAPIS